MTKINKGLLCSSLLCLLVGTTAVTTHAQSIRSEVLASVEKSQLIVGQRYYISGNSLNLRNSNSTVDKSNVVGQLSLNDVVEVYDLLNAGTPLVQVKVIKSSLRTDGSANYYVSKDFLSSKPAVSSGGSSSSKYFVIQNVATERTRVYERCTTSPDCPHKLVMETEMVVGRPEEGLEGDPKAFITWLGHARISEWVKFYQDVKGHYPRWYSEGTKTPGPINGLLGRTIGARKWIVKGGDGKSTIHGAFGWYAAKVTPADPKDGMNYQWMHGTMGWGSDGATPIELTRSSFMNIVSNPGSAGCTRLENRAIAYLRSLLPVGTDIYRVYARESSRNLSRYAGLENNPAPWNFILTKIGGGKSGGLEADANKVMAGGFSQNDLLEQGTYQVDRYPNVSPLNYKEMPSSGRSGDRYRIDSDKAADAARTNFRGYFLVDEGRFVDYAHPDEAASRYRVKVSGLPDFRNSVPEFLKTTGSHNPPAVTYR
ncbi:L,D-transpeptidase [Bdellovibrio sp. HCB2-146]|uniref:L,D-transpeptidase n=1 Tax=Bdellovibrio sp. HCB2-146 TaxID=3394362 RepID=UPI0039BC8583